MNVFLFNIWNFEYLESEILKKVILRVVLAYFTENYDVACLILRTPTVHTFILTEYRTVSYDPHNNKWKQVDSENLAL